MSGPIHPQLRGAWFAYARNGRWGTCADCPQVDGEKLPEMCRYTTRYDHQLTLDSLVQQVKRHELTTVTP